MSFGAIYDKFDSAIRWLGYLDWGWWGLMNVLVQNFFDCFYWWWSMIVPAGCCNNSVSFAMKYWSPNTLSQNLERVGRRSLSLFDFGVQIVCSSPTWVSLMNHLFTTSTHDVAGVFSNSYLSLRIGRMSFFCCMACWVLFGSSSAKTSQHSHKTHKISNHFCSSKIIPPSAKAIQEGVGAYHMHLPFQGVCSKSVGNHQTSKGITRSGTLIPNPKKNQQKPIRVNPHLKTRHYSSQQGTIGCRPRLT